MNDLVRRTPAIEGELLVPGTFGMPGYKQVRDLSRMKNVTPGEEAPARPMVCSAGIKGCPFDPPHAHLIHGRGRKVFEEVVSPACSNCGEVWRGHGMDEFRAYYDERGWCRECRSRFEPDHHFGRD